MNISICIDALFMKKDFIRGMETVKKAGFNNFEFWNWQNKNIPTILDAKERLGMNITAFCTKMVSLVDATKRDEYISGLKESIKVAEKLGCRKLITQVGAEMKEFTREEQRENLIAGLKACVPVLTEASMILLVEPLNTYVDHNGYYLYKSDEAFDIIEKVASNNVKVLFDIYHQQIMEGNIITNVTKNISLIGHFHAAGIPGRHEILSGEINYIEVFKAIDKAGFSEYVGLEYIPAEDAYEGLLKLTAVLGKMQ